MERPENYNSITTLDISYENLTELPSWVSECKNLKILNCSNNNITQIYNLLPRLKELYCTNNKIIQIDNLPKTLKELICYNNLLKYEFEHTLENIRNYNNKQNKLPK